MDALAGSLDNLALAATINIITVQQLTLANLSLTKSGATIMAANKKLTKSVVCYNSAPQGRGGGRGRGVTMLIMAPKQFGASTAGGMGTRYCIPAKPAM
jgi:hypothetical protein